jgi:hypothetical protein
MSKNTQLRTLSSFRKNEIRLPGDGGVREFEKTFVLAEVPAEKPDLSLQLTILLTSFASASTPKVGRTRCVCDSYDGDPVFDYPKNDQKWKPAQLQVTVTVIDRWKLLDSGCDTSQGTVNSASNCRATSGFRVA